jgi:hypothetical protein
MDKGYDGVEREAKTTLQAHVYNFMSEVRRHTSGSPISQEALNTTIDELTRAISMSKNWLDASDPDKKMLRHIRDGLKGYLR